MLCWGELETERPDLTEIGHTLLYQFGVGLGFLATVRKDGGPRVHPVCPVAHDGHLYVFIVGDSPKRHDLERDGRYALHSFPPADNDDEFYCTGAAKHIDDPGVRLNVSEASKHDVQADEVLFELYLERVLCTTWENPRQPDTRPIHTKWCC
jgi:hypothetical protein